jgi:hypothetical protein
MQTAKYLTIAAGLLVVALAGCSTGTISEGQATLPAEESSAGYVDRLSSQPTVTQNDAFRGALLLLDGEDQAESFKQRVETLRDREMIDQSWDVKASAPITRGQLAYMIYQVTEMQGGVTLLLFGPSQRYCLRELQYAGVIAEGSWFAPVTGMEMVAVLNRADTMIQTGQPPHVLNLKGE